MKTYEVKLTGTIQDTITLLAVDEDSAWEIAQAIVNNSRYPGRDIQWECDELGVGEHDPE
jgi:hypothetical protein